MVAREEAIMTPSNPVPIEPGGKVRCPSCGDHFQVKGAPPEKPPRPSGPACPKCGAVLSMETVRTILSGLGFVGQEKMWYCPDCMTILGFTAWKR
jgi:hypothetical protein